AAVWAIVLLAIGNLLWLLRPVVAKTFHLLSEIVMPFLVGLLIAYVLHPIVQALENRRVPRMVAVLLIYAAFMLIISIGIVNAIP
ncbi:AI-2E family transporter, partial [Anoxybacillus sp. LAT_38]|nr:AI-2E family transporter [Anoxybacillus sp. LAT_38]